MSEAKPSEANKRVVRRNYPEEFKAEAIRLVTQHGYSCHAASEKLGVPVKTLSSWVRPHRTQDRLKAIAVGVENDDPAALRAQIGELQKQLRRAEMERDILKKFSQYAVTQMPGGL
jgi:transposase-like protein